MKLELDEVRRLTGPNLLSDAPGAIADVFIEDIDLMQVVNCFKTHVNTYQQQLGWPKEVYFRLYDGGASVSIPAAMDLLYSACELVELAWDLCVDELTSKHEVNSQERAEALTNSVKEEQHPELIALLKAAKQAGVRCLADDDEVSLGTGVSAQTWTIDNLPKPDALDWSCFSDVPLALVTGTNGKSTSVRLAAEIAKHEGVNAGVTSTDFIKVGSTIIDEGDYSGPGGARMLLRDKRTEMAFLEVARGGLLRRGLPVNSANAALVTNVASDHLGQYGINTVDEIAHVKLMVAKAISAKQTLVLNADDERLVKFVPKFFPNDKPLPICWFSPNPDNPLIVKQIKAKRPCAYVSNTEVIYSDEQTHHLGKLANIPMTVNGTAIHNVQNALGVVGLCKAMGISNQAIKQGLAVFGKSADDNPGRGNIYQVKGAQVIVDFAHNAHSMQAVLQMAANMAKSLPTNAHTHVMFSHGGDRSNQEILDVADEVLAFKPKTFILSELEVYLRGRELGEISDLVQTHLLSKNVPQANIVLANDPLDGAKKAVNLAQQNDLVLLFVLSNREEVQAFLSA